MSDWASGFNNKQKEQEEQPPSNGFGAVWGENLAEGDDVDEGFADFADGD